jgi:hypothetical protein
MLQRKRGKMRTAKVVAEKGSAGGYAIAFGIE